MVRWECDTNSMCGYHEGRHQRESSELSEDSVCDTNWDVGIMSEDNTDVRGVNRVQ